MDNTKSKGTLDKIKGVLSEMLGIEKDDIQNEDSFTDDLRMGPTELSDLSEKLSNAGYDTSKLSFEEIETIEDLGDYVASQEDI